MSSALTLLLLSSAPTALAKKSVLHRASPLLRTAAITNRLGANGSNALLKRAVPRSNRLQNYSMSKKNNMPRRRDEGDSWKGTKFERAAAERGAAAESEAVSTFLKDKKKSQRFFNEVEPYRGFARF